MWIDRNNRMDHDGELSGAPDTESFLDTNAKAAGASSEPIESCLRFGQDGEPYYQLTPEVVIWPERYGVRVSGQWIDLTPTEIRVLTILADEPGKVWTRYDLVKACHKGYTTVADRSMNYTIFQLRRKVPPFNYMIETVRNKGYRLNPKAKNDLIKILILVVAGLWAKLLQSGPVGWTAATTVGLSTLAIPVVSITQLPPDSIWSVADLWSSRAELIQTVNLKDATSASPDAAQASIHGASALTYLGNDQYAILSDAPPNVWSSKERSAKVHYISLALQPKRVLLDGHGWRKIETVELKDRNGSPFIAETANLSKSQPPQPMQVDPEGLVSTPWGTLWVAEEYSSVLREFSRDGQLIQELKLPDRFQVVYQQNSSRIDKSQRVGTSPLRGVVGLTISPDGRYLFVASESPLQQDGGRRGQWIRILQYDLIAGNWREYPYRLESRTCVLTDLLAMDESTLLVIEHDLIGTAHQARSRVYRAGLQSSTELTNVPQLPTEGTAGWLKGMDKALVLDSSKQVTSELSGTSHLPMFQGITFGPTLPDGRTSILLVSDDGYRRDWPSMVAVYALNRSLSNDSSAGR